ncbi:hypothetical protein BCD67_02215 [Oscillatoriales cyanobacterium USR001]|nr:hypothetical protein BCD67_02215 [Oscillatoriales cyanobacterium USR001]
MLQPLIQNYIPNFLSGNWELTNLPTRIILPQTISPVAGTLTQFYSKIQPNPDWLKYVWNFLGVSGISRAIAFGEAIPAKYLIPQGCN